MKCCRVRDCRAGDWRETREWEIRGQGNQSLGDCISTVRGTMCMYVGSRRKLHLQVLP